MKLTRYIKRKFFSKVKSVSLNETSPIHKDFGFNVGLPIDRMYIESYIEKNKDSIRGKVLEIAESTYSKKYGSKVEEFQIIHYDPDFKGASLIADITKHETLPDNYTDCFICTQTLNVIFDLEKAIAGAYKLLNKDGVFIGTVPGISQVTRFDKERWGDYWRFTDMSIIKLFENSFGKGNVEVETFGNALAATAFIQGVVISELPDPSKLLIKDDEYQLIIGIKAIKRSTY